MQQTLFEKILLGEIPCKAVYEDEHTFAFYDIHPQAPVHVLVIPKTKIVNVHDMQETQSELMGRVLFAAKKVAEVTGIADSGYRLVFNIGKHGGQSVDYLHCHVLGGRSLAWPPG